MTTNYRGTKKSVCMKGKAGNIIMNPVMSLDTRIGFSVNKL